MDLFVGLFVVVFLVVVVGWCRLWRTYRRCRWIERWQVPLFLHHRISDQRPGIDDKGLRQAELALKQWFRCCARAGGRQLAMPSRLVDDYWHAFILCTHDHADFCQQAFGRFLHHQPWDGSQSGGEKAWRRVWYLSCMDEGINPEEPEKIPLLFALDGRLGLDDGHFYDWGREGRRFRVWRRDGQHSSGVKHDQGVVAVGNGHVPRSHAEDGKGQLILDLQPGGSDGGCGSGFDGGGCGGGCGGD